MRKLHLLLAEWRQENYWADYRAYRAACAFAAIPMDESGFPFLTAGESDASSDDDVIFGQVERVGA